MSTITDAQVEAAQTSLGHEAVYVGAPTVRRALDAAYLATTESGKPGETSKAIALGAAVLTRIEDPAVREIAIRNALTEAAKAMSENRDPTESVPPLSELDEMVSSAIEAAIETSPEFNHGWRSMPDKELIPEILDEIPIEYTEADIAVAIYRYKVRRLLGTAGRAALTTPPQPETQGDTIAIDRSLLEAAVAEIRGWKVAKGGDDQVVLNLEAALRNGGAAE